MMKVEDETVGVVVDRSDILEAHGWHNGVGISRNDELDRIGGICSNGQFISLPIENGERHRSREIVEDCRLRWRVRREWLHDHLAKQRRDVIHRLAEEFKLEVTGLSRW